MKNQVKRPLIIVESPTKAKTISRFMKSKYDVKASLGHVRDLPKSKLGVDIDNGFEPKYITIRGKGDTIKQLGTLPRRHQTFTLLLTRTGREKQSLGTCAKF